MSEVAVIALEVAVISSVVVFFSLLIGNYVRKKIKGLPTGECACCYKSKKQLLKEYHKCSCSKESK